MNRFEMAEKIFSLMKGRADRFDIFTQNNESDSIEFRNNRLNSVNSKQSGGLGLRVFKENHQGLSSCNAVSEDGRFGLIPRELIERSIQSASQGDEAKFLLPGSVSNSVETGKCNLDTEGKTVIEKGKSVISRILSDFPDGKVSFFFSRSKQDSLLLNSSSGRVRFGRESYSFSVSVALIEEGNIQEIWDSCSMPTDLQYDPLDKAVSNLVFLCKHSKKNGHVTSGKSDVIFTPKAFQSLVSIIMSAFKGSMIHKKSSYISDKLGKKITDAMFSIYEDPFYKPGISYSLFDHEGVPCSKKYFVNKGVVEAILTSLHSAEKLGVKPSGNGFRSYASFPSDEATNLFVEPGTTSFQEMLSSMKNGILVDQMIGAGQSNTLSGEFSVNLDLAFKVENGEMTGRIKNCMLADNVFEMLNRMESVGSDLFSYGDMNLPYVRFKDLNLTVAG